MKNSASPPAASAAFALVRAGHSDRPSFLVIGHRGARGHAPENTLLSIRRALELGAPAIEVDVQFVDGQLIILHDATLQRTTNGRGRVARKTFAALRMLDAGQGERIPTLAEVCSVVRGRALLNIELKGRRTARPVAELIERLVREEGWSFADFLVSSFRRPELRQLIGRGIPLGLLFARRPRGWLKLATQFGAVALHPALRFTSAKFIARAHAAGLRVYPYTVNAPEDLARLRGWGADGVFTDFPDRALADD